MVDCGRVGVGAHCLEGPLAPSTRARALTRLEEQSKRE